MTQRACDCGCGRVFEGRESRTYFDGKCRGRAYRQRLKEAAEALGLPEGRITPKTLRSDPQDVVAVRNAPRRTRSRQNGMRVYLPTPQDGENLLALLERHDDDTLRAVRDATRRALERRHKRERS